MYCPNCGKSNPSGAAFCMGCGHELPSFSTSVTCPFCGADGQEYQLNCTKCGKELPRGQKIDPLSGAEASRATTKSCPICGRPMSVVADRCSYCSRPEDDSSAISYAHETELPLIGGILIIIAGILGGFFGLLIMANVATGIPGAGSATCCAGLLCLFGLIAIGGGFSAVGRNSATFGIIGGVFGILSIGFFIGALLSLIGLILVAISHHEFQE